LRAEIEGLADSEMMEELRQTVEGKADATAVQEMLANISSLKLAGTNGFTPETDTFEAWAEKGNCIWFFESEGQLNGQAGNYGLLANFVNPGNDVHQLWLSQPAGGIMHRSGNQTTGLGEWILMIDSDNIGQYVGIPTQLKTAGLNGFTHDTDTPENWIKKGNCVWFFNEFGNMENQPSNYGLLVNLMEKPDGQDVHQIWLTQSGGEMYHRGGGAGGFEPWRKVIDDKNLSSETYTFVVDSNEKLAEWASNDRTKGQDYTSVLIKKGTWTGSQGIDLGAAGTIAVVGEPGSKVTLNDVTKGLYYNTVPDTNDYYIQNVHIEININSSINEDSSVFYKCARLSNCNAIISSEMSSDTGRILIGYDYCEDLNGCYGKSFSVNNRSHMGFKECKRLYNCRGSGRTNNSKYSVAVGFWHCNGVILCGANGYSTEGVYIDCFSTITPSGSYLCADTPAGGFNDTTNPSA
jgi:hypothetical protein